MALGDEIVVRLIVWQGRLQQGPIQQKQIKVYSDQLKESINESVRGTQWRYKMWKTYELGSIGEHKLEVRTANKANGILLRIFVSSRSASDIPKALEQMRCARQYMSCAAGFSTLA